MAQLRKIFLSRNRGMKAAKAEIRADKLSPGNPSFRTVCSSCCVRIIGRLVDIQSGGIKRKRKDEGWTVAAFR